MHQRRYAATNGQCKLIYVPVPLRIAEVEVFEDGRKIGEGLRAQVELPRSADNPWTSRRGVKALKKEECADPAATEPEETFDYRLSEDSGEPTRVRRTWAVDVEREVFLGLGRVFGAEVRTRIGRERAMGVALELPAGFDYRGGRGNGAMWWTAP